MPVYDRICDACGAIKLDCLEPLSAPNMSCGCGGTLKRGWTQRGAAVIGDDIPGGMDVKHGICNDDGSPRRFYSKSEMRQAAEARGLVNMVRHVPLPGSDKSPHTVRWDAPRVLSEEERVAHMKALYAAEGIDLDHLPPPSTIEGVQSVVEDRVHRIIAQAVTERFGV